ncbi:hypothetical protein E2C01_033355 [Portunus trituberculatus]|uniref:Uncharacterized protein n=1 Tax=Portunus trituberculatus TaxID=210409 RepID=A0A5B7F377_PORTR|nr:hypothetical protein [Portunus trituberculatus]
MSGHNNERRGLQTDSHHARDSWHAGKRGHVHDLDAGLEYRRGPVVVDAFDAERNLDAMTRPLTLDGIHTTVPAAPNDLPRVLQNAVTYNVYTKSSEFLFINVYALMNILFGEGEGYGRRPANVALPALRLLANLGVAWRWFCSAPHPF